ncbi:ATP-binding protein [Dehalobacter sp. DCM]|uniref:ATP-binding protein n=1 Tax=Dehalobacter sp. DCM TaxID=2907827 RepID=UPI0030821753|nr:ATP-binding protein [Dehalobacter sp. DCM]
MTISEVIVDSINVSEYEEFLASKKPNTYFEEMQTYFKKVHSETGVEYVYIEHKISPNKIEYIFDSEEDCLGDIDEMYTPKAHTSVESFFTTAETSVLWGTLITGYAPIINDNGEIISVVGTDVDINFIYKELLKRIGQIIIYTLVMVLLFSLLIYFVLNEEIRRRRIAEKKLKMSIMAIQNLLDNAGQGFLYFGSDLRIKPEYSRECLRLLGPEPEKRTFQDVIYPDNSEDNHFVKEVLTASFTEEDIQRKEVFLSLLPSELLINSYYIKLEYRVISGNKQEDSDELMVILTDATEQRVLEEQMETDRKTLKMIVLAVANKNDLIEVIQEFLLFTQETIHQLHDTPCSFDSVMVDIKRTVHTFKGLFGQFEIFRLVRCLHDVEEELKIYEKREMPDCSGLGVLLHGFDLEGILKDELNILQTVLGIDFMGSEKTIEIPESKLIELEDQISAHFSPAEATVLINMIKGLRNRMFSELLGLYPNYVKGLALKLDKPIYPLEIMGGDFPVDTAKYRAFTKTLVHVFANCIDHGIESREERIVNGKDGMGRILCEISRVGDSSIVIKIADDGNGIDYERIRQKAGELGDSGDEVDTVVEKDVYKLIFFDGVSSKEEASDISGRGIGMAVVKQELEKIGGRLEIASRPGKGTTLTFILPI